MSRFLFFFFFQAEDGILDVAVTGVQTCALPILRGGAPGSRETELLAPETLVDRVDAIVLSGGSAFGLDAASGVMEWLAEAGRGFAVGSTIRSPSVPVPIVPAAILFDLA